MYTKTKDSKENKSRAVATNVGQNKKNGKQGFELVNSQPGSIAKPKPQESVIQAHAVYRAGNTELREKIPTRGGKGGGTPDVEGYYPDPKINMEKDNGLSTYLSISHLMDQGLTGKITTTDTERLPDGVKDVFDNNPPGHISLAPTTDDYNEYVNAVNNQIIWQESEMEGFHSTAEGEEHTARSRPTHTTYKGRMPLTGIEIGGEGIIRQKP